jgi:hypothetical protein
VEKYVLIDLLHQCYEIEVLFCEIPLQKTVSNVEDISVILNASRCLIGTFIHMSQNKFSHA